MRLPYHLSAPTQAVALAALAHAATLLATVEVIKGQRDRIVAELAALGLDPVPSDANFVLFGGLADAARDVAGAARPGRPRPRRRHAPLSSCHGRDPGRDRRLPRRDGADRPTHRQERPLTRAGRRRQTAAPATAPRPSEPLDVGASVELELDLDGTGESDISTGVPVLRPHARQSWPSTR